MGHTRYWPVGLLFLTACILDPSRCDYEQRSLDLVSELTGTPLPAGSPPGEARIFLNESKGSLEDRSMTITVAVPAAGATSLVQLRNGQKVLYTFPLGYGESNEWSANVMLRQDTLRFFVLHTLAQIGQLNLVVEVGIQGRLGVYGGRVRLAASSDWHRPYCD